MAFAFAGDFVHGAVSEADTVLGVVANYLPGTSGLGNLKVVGTEFKVSPAGKVFTVSLNETGAYIPFTAETLAQLKGDIRSALGYSECDVVVKVVEMSGGKVKRERSLDDLVLFAPKDYAKHDKVAPFVVDYSAPKAPEGLQDAIIALWQSHGWYFEPKLNRWEWQRARIFQTVEDLYTQSYVMPYLMPMLTNAGAYVMSPRERDTNTVEVVVDNDGQFAYAGYSESGKWYNTDSAGFAYTQNPIQTGVNLFRSGTARKADVTTKGQKANKATWSADIPQAGTYAVYVSYQTLPNSTTAAHYTVNAADGAHEFDVNQTMGGGTWIYLGHFPLAGGKSALPVVELTSEGSQAGKAVTADAVKIGGGMGNIARKVGKPLDNIDYRPVTSGYPRFTEAAMYWLQYAGAPDSVYSISGFVNDYNDDYRSRAEWVNWLAGGSDVLPQREGLNVPVDLAFAFHSDAGTTRNDSIIGTLGIYCTDGRQYGEAFADGSSRLASRDLTDLVMTNIVNDVRAQFEPSWTRRGMWDKSYYEARVPQVPTMLLELLSHQNFADMKYGLDPMFRFTVSRAIYKGMLQFLAQRDGRPYVVQPLPVNSMEILKDGNGAYTLRWKETVDSLEATATPTYYIIEERIGTGAFAPVAKVEHPEYKIKVNDNAIHSYRVKAGNAGGVSFNSEVLALCNMPGKPLVNIVNGFTRVSAPDWFEAGDIAGFYDARDHGVPYVEDISFIGSMFEFRRDIPWMDDDAAGFGASRANYEDKVIAGNTYDFVYTHGEAIKEAGYGFVSTSVEAFMNTTVRAEERYVDLILGKQKEIARGRGVYGTYYKTFPQPLQNKLRAMTQDGVSVFVSGAFVATDLWDNPFSSPEVAKADQEFATQVLGYHWRVGQATVEGEAYQVQTRFPQFTSGEYDFSAELNDECYAVESPDSFYPADDKTGATFMRYTENNLIAGTALDADGYRAVVIGFPFETIKGSDARASLMAQVMDFLSHAKAKETTAADKTKKAFSKKNKKSKKHRK